MPSLPGEGKGAGGVEPSPGGNCSGWGSLLVLARGRGARGSSDDLSVQLPVVKEGNPSHDKGRWKSHLRLSEAGRLSAPLQAVESGAAVEGIAWDQGVDQPIECAVQHQEWMAVMRIVLFEVLAVANQLPECILRAASEPLQRTSRTLPPLCWETKIRSRELLVPHIHPPRSLLGRTYRRITLSLDGGLPGDRPWQ